MNELGLQGREVTIISYCTVMKGLSPCQRNELLSRASGSDVVFTPFIYFVCGHVQGSEENLQGFDSRCRYPLSHFTSL